MPVNLQPNANHLYFAMKYSVNVVLSYKTLNGEIKNKEAVKEFGIVSVQPRNSSLKDDTNINIDSLNINYRLNKSKYYFKNTKTYRS